MAMVGGGLYHKAARDGYLNVLRETTRQDCNARDEDGMTPTLWAAFEGNLEALRLLTGRGGDPEKADNFGNTALHLAAARGHADVVAFLVAFGVNLYSVDVDSHTAEELAAANSPHDPSGSRSGSQEGILRFLDAERTRLEICHPKKAKKMQERAAKDSEALSRSFRQLQKKADKMLLLQGHRDQVSRYQRHGQPCKLEEKFNLANFDNRSSSSRCSVSSMDGTESSCTSGGSKLDHLSKNRSTSPLGNLLRKMQGVITRSGLLPSYRDHQPSDSKQKKTSAKDKTVITQPLAQEFKVQDVGADGTRSVRKLLSGIQRDSEILFVSSSSSLTSSDSDSKGFQGEKSRIADSDLYGKSSAQGSLRSASGLFDRPGFGSMAFRRISTLLPDASLAHLLINDDDGTEHELGDSEDWDTISETKEIARGALKVRTGAGMNTCPTDDTVSFAGSVNNHELGNSESSMNLTEQESFKVTTILLESVGMARYLPSFKQENIDSEAILLLNENDIRDMKVPLGLRKKLIKAIEDWKVGMVQEKTSKD